MTLDQYADERLLAEAIRAYHTAPHGMKTWALRKLQRINREVMERDLERAGK